MISLLINTDCCREVRRLQELRRIIQEECDSLLLRKERLREEVCQAVWLNNPWLAHQRLPAGATAAGHGDGSKQLDTTGCGELGTTATGGCGGAGCTAFRAWSLDMLDGLTGLDRLAHLTGTNRLGDQDGWAGEGVGERECAQPGAVPRHQACRRPAAGDHGELTQTIIVNCTPSEPSKDISDFCSASVLGGVDENPETKNIFSTTALGDKDYSSTDQQLDGDQLSSDRQLDHQLSPNWQLSDQMSSDQQLSDQPAVVHQAVLKDSWTQIPEDVDLVEEEDGALHAIAEAYKVEDD